jgi:hypothetical protein
MSHSTHSSGQLVDPMTNPSKFTQIILSLVAALFGIATVIAGARVLLGADPGYTVFRPLLFYNTAMGIAYVAAGVVAWRNAERGILPAAAIFGLNFLVLLVVSYLYATGSAVAIESIRAMVLRTVVWLVLFVGLVWVARRSERIAARGG